MVQRTISKFSVKKMQLNPVDVTGKIFWENNISENCYKNIMNCFTKTTLSDRKFGAKKQDFSRPFLGHFFQKNFPNF